VLTPPANDAEPLDKGEYPLWLQDIKSRILCDEADYVEMSKRTWPSEITAEWLVDNFDIDKGKAEAVMPALALMTKELNRQIAEDSLRFARQVNEAVAERWESLRSAYADTPAASESGRPERSSVLFSRSVNGKGGVARVDITREEYPFIAKLHDNLNFLEERRRDMVRLHLESH
jgi:hypothetical protein